MQQTSEKPPPIAREVLRRIIEREFGPAAVIWPQLAALTLIDVCLLLSCERLRAAYVFQSNAYPQQPALPAAVAAVQPPLTGEDRDRAELLPALLTTEPIPVTVALAAVAPVADGVPVEWALSFARGRDA